MQARLLQDVSEWYVVLYVRLCFVLFIVVSYFLDLLLIVNATAVYVVF